MPARARGELAEMEATKQLVEMLRADYRPGMRILDVGCNVGHYLRGIRRLDPTAAYTGVDAYPHYVELARELFANDRHAQFEVKSILEPIYPDDPRDLVFCCNVLLHLPGYETALRNLVASTARVCYVRTCLAEYTTIVKRALRPVFSPEGEPLDFSYHNTYEVGGFTDFARSLGCAVEIVEDRCDPNAISREYDTTKAQVGTRIVGGQQVDGNVIYHWKWAVLRVNAAPRARAR